MANRNQDYYSGSRRSQENWRAEEERGSYGGNYRSHYGSEREDNEADAGTRGGNYDQGRVQYGRRDQNEQSGSQGRYAGYGDFGRGNYGGERSGWSGQDQYGQGGYGQGNYGPRQSNYGRQDRGGQSRGGYGGSGGTGYSGGYGGQGYSGGGYGYGGSGSGSDRGWSEPYGEGQQYDRGGHYGKGPKGYQRSDERIKEMICERLREDPDIDPSDVTIGVQGGKVTLDGTVDSRRTKNAIEEVAEQFGSQDIQNNLRVQRAGQQSGESSAASGSRQKQH